MQGECLHLVLTLLVRVDRHRIPVLDWFPEAYQELSSWLLFPRAQGEACVVRVGWTFPYPDFIAVVLALVHGFPQDHTHICALNEWFVVPTSLSPGAGISVRYFRLGV